MNWSRKSNRGSPQCGAFAVGPLVGAPGVGGMTPGLYRRASAAEAPLPRASLCLRTVFRGSAEVFVRLFSGRWDVRFAPPYVKRYTAPTYPPRSRSVSRLLCAARNGTPR